MQSYKFILEPQRSQIFYGDQQDETFTIPTKHIRSGKSIIQYSNQSRRSNSSKGFTRIKTPEIALETTLKKKLSKSSSQRSSRMKLTKSQQSSRSNLSCKDCCKIKTTKLKVVGMGPLSRVVSNFRDEKLKYQKVRNSITAEELNLNVDVVQNQRNRSVQDMDQPPRQILISPPELTDRSTSRHKFDPNQKEFYLPINSNSDIDGWEFDQKYAATGTFGGPRQQSHHHLKSTLPSNRPETATTNQPTQSKLSQPIIDNSFPINNSIMNDINILSADTDQTISQEDINNSQQQMQTNIANSRNIEHNPMTFQNSLSMTQDQEPQKVDVKNVIISQVAPQIHKELAIFYMERQRSLQKIFDQRNLMNKIDQICEKDILVKKMLFDCESDANTAFNRLSQLINQFIDFGQEMKIEEQQRRIINLEQQMQIQNEKKQKIINEQNESISNLQANLSQMNQNQGSEILKYNLKTKKLLEVQDQKQAQIEYLKKECQILKENFEIQLETTLKDKLNQNLQDYKDKIDHQNQYLKNSYEDTQKQINRQLHQKEKELMELNEKIEQIQNNMKQKHNQTLTEIRAKYQSEIADLKNQNLTQTHNFQQEYQIFQEQMSKFDQTQQQQSDFENKMMEQRSTFEDKISQKDMLISQKDIQLSEYYSQISIKDSKINDLLKEISDIQNKNFEIQNLLKTQQFSEYSIFTQKQQQILCKNEALKQQVRDMQYQLDTLKSNLKQQMENEKSAIIEFGQKMAQKIQNEFEIKNQGKDQEIQKIQEKMKQQMKENSENQQKIKENQEKIKAYKEYQEKIKVKQDEMKTKFDDQIKAYKDQIQLQQEKLKLQKLQQEKQMEKQMEKLKIQFEKRAEMEIKEAEKILQEMRDNYWQLQQFNVELENKINSLNEEKVQMQQDFSKKLEIILSQNEKKYKERRDRARSKSQDKICAIKNQSQSQIALLKQKQLMLEKELHQKSQVELDLDKSLDFINQQYSQSGFQSSGPFFVHQVTTSSLSRSRHSGLINNHSVSVPASTIGNATSSQSNWLKSGQFQGRQETGSSFKIQTTGIDSDIKNKENQFQQQQL